MNVRPDYLLTAESSDDIARVVVSLTTEVWALRDRLLVLEDALTQDGSTAPGAVEREPGPELTKRLQAERTAFTNRVLGAVLPQDQRLSLGLSTLVTSMPTTSDPVTPTQSAARTASTQGDKK